MIVPEEFIDLFFQALLPVGYCFPGIFIFEDQAAIGEDMGIESLGQKRIPLSFNR